MHGAQKGYLGLPYLDVDARAQAAGGGAPPLDPPARPRARAGGRAMRVLSNRLLAVLDPEA